MIQKLSWALWLVGTAIIVLSWFQSISPTLGWVGFGLALLGSLLSWTPRSAAALSPRPANVVADLDRLVQLRDRGDITEEQYLRQRDELLGK